MEQSNNWTKELFGAIQLVNLVGFPVVYINGQFWATVNYDDSFEDGKMEVEGYHITFTLNEFLNFSPTTAGEAEKENLRVAVEKNPRQKIYLKDHKYQIFIETVDY